MRLAATLIAGFLFVACTVKEASREYNPETHPGELFPIERHVLYPPYGLNAQDRADQTVQIASGIVTDREAALPQPIPFSHNIHAGEMGIDCQYCHTEARKSIHAGVPPLQTCMNCHEHIAKDNPDVLKIHEHYCESPPCIVTKGPAGPIPPKEATPIAWNKVHDLPDYVHFAHNRHVRAGVSCTECHGQVTEQGKKETVFSGDYDAGGYPILEERVQSVMVREASMQMGWCLDCHASHPSIDTNYGEQADLRRAELKDCWTCHK